MTVSRRTYNGNKYMKLGTCNFQIVRNYTDLDEILKKWFYNSKKNYKIIKF